MSSNWEKVYPERINWTNRGGPPLDENNLNKGDGALYIIDERVLTLGFIKEINIEPDAWVPTDDGGIYPFNCFIECTDYSDDSSPIATVFASSGNETVEEHTSIEMIKKIWCSSSGIRIYASDRPTTAIKILLRGK